MAITLGFNVASDARSAAQEFIEQMNNIAKGTLRMGESISHFNADGQLLSQTFKALSASGVPLEATLKATAAGFELMSGKADRAAQSIKDLKAAEEAATLAARRNDANNAEGQLGGLKGLQPGGNANQINAAEAAIQRIRAAIESGSVSLARFQQLYNQVVANPKAIIPNLTSEEAGVVKSLRTMQQGFDVTGDKAARMGEKLSISWAGILRLFEAQVIKRITGALQSALVEGVQASVDYSVRIAEIGTISQKSGITTNEWASGIRRLSSAFGQNQADVAEAAYQALSNQVTKSTDTFQFLETALRFSKATVTTTADSVNLLSSALKSFDIPTSHAERVAGIFFKTIELGRVRGNEMADTFGRIGTIAADAGIKLEEVSAAIATLTVKGMKFQDASTLISNLILKLVRPTAEMKELFDEWGVASGQAAIATFGFNGVLAKLDVEAQKGSSRLGELFNQIRAFRGAINLTGSTFGDFQKNLQEITEGQGEFNRAVDIVMESFGDRVKKQMNEIKVFFSEDFGDGIITAVVKISESLGGMANVLGKLETILTPVILATVGYKAGLLAVSAGQKVYTLFITENTTALAQNAAAQTVNTGATAANVPATQAAATATQGQTTALQGATVATNNLSAAMAALNVFMGGFGIGFTLGMYLFNQDDERRIESVVKNLQKLEGMRFDALRAVDRSTTPFKSEVNRIQEEYDNRFKIILQYYTNNVRAADDAKKKAIQNLKETTEQTKVSAKNYFEAITQGLKRLKDAAAEAKQMIEASLKSSEGVERKLNDSIFDTRMKYASEGRLDNSLNMVVDDQKSELIKTRINEITALARNKFREGTKESVDDARRLYGEVEKLTSELFDIETKKRRTQFDEMVRRGSVMPTAMDFDPSTGGLKARYEFTVRTVELEDRLRSLANEKLRAESALRAEKERQLKITLDLELREQARVKAIQQAVSEIEKIRVTDDKGDPSSKYKDNPRQALADFDRQARIARQAAAQLEIRDRLQTLDFLAKQREALEKEVNTRVMSERTRSEQENVQLQRKAVKERLTDVERQFDNATNRMASDAGRIAVTLKTIGEADINGPSLMERIFDPRITATNQKKFDEMRANLQDLQKKALGDNETFAANKTADNLAKARRSLDEFIIKYKEYVETFTGKKISELPEDSPGMRRLNELFRERNSLEEGMAQQEKAAADLGRMSNAGERMKTALGGIPDIWTLIDRAVSTSGPVITKTLEEIISRTDELIRKARTAADEIRALGGVVPPPPAPPADPNGVFGGTPRTYAFGGRGSDDQLAYINKRETVMTGEATDKWSPLLRAMNAGMTPNQAVGGGNVTTIGDININVPQATPTESVRHIARGLRRALRRGTATLE